MRIALCNEVVAELSFAAQAKLAAQLGYAGLEVAPFTLDAEAPHLLPASRRAELRRIAEGEGAPITSLHWLLVAPSGLSITDAALHERTLDVMQRLIGLAADLGATVLVHGSPKQRVVAVEGDAGRAEAAMAKAGDWAAQHGLTYCLEPLDPGQTNWARSVEEAAGIVARIANPALRTMLDVSAAGNGESEPVEALLRRFIPGGWIAHVHLNDRNRRAPGQGSDRFAPVLRALRETGYAGFCAVEPFDYHPDGPTSAARAIGYLRGVMKFRRMTFTLIETQRFEWPFRLRLPFRFGVITVTHGRQAVVRARIRLEDGSEQWGVAAETLAAKWFDKDSRLSDAQNEHQLRRALELAEAATLAAGANTAFGHFADTYADVTAAAARENLNPLVASYGRALLDRAMLDALLKARGVSFFAGMRANIGGMAPHGVVPDLPGFDFGSLLARQVPLKRLHARHTVGLVDPITAADQTERVNDGLPETLEEVVGTYRHRYWKLKVGGNVEADVDRLSRIAAVLDRLHGGYHASLDGNEQYEDAEGALALWRAMQAEPRLKKLCASILYIEQPVKRARALETGMQALGAERPVIIDESDGPLDAFVTGRALGYAGVSSKACKGVWRSLINLARCRAWGDRFFMSAEDLTTLAGVCVQQDLALVALLGLPHVERNGHHFVDGFSGRPKAEAVRFMEAHPDLYADTSRGPRLKISEGALEIGSLDVPGLGAAIEPDFSAMEAMPKAAWS